MNGELKPFTPNALRVLESRYLRRNARGQLAESPEDMFRRVAEAVASAETAYGGSVATMADSFFALMSERLFLPNSPTLMNAGLNNGQLSACFVLPVEDNMNGIFNTLRYAALIQQSGGGTGFNFSHLRPAGDLVNGHSGTASGPVSFMKVFDAATEHIKQGGKRRGANMGVLNIEHPDILAFVRSKRGSGVLKNFNISVGISDRFMEALDKNEDWLLRHPGSGDPVSSIPASELWKEITDAAWETGDPGLIFLDTINRFNPTPALGRIESTNPCGEVPLLAYEPCNLGSVNLSIMLKCEEGRWKIDWEKLEQVVDTGIRFLDNVIEVNHYIIPEIREMAQANRKIGLGVMGWAEMLIRLNIPYASEEAVSLAGKLMSFIADAANNTSATLAAERGAFRHFGGSIYSAGRPLRNATRTSIAPTGTISIIAGTSSSIEPLFALAYRRSHVLGEQQLDTVSELFIERLRELGLYNEKIMKEVMRAGTCFGLTSIPGEIRELFRTAMDITPDWHLRHQVAFQSFTDNAVSKTVNLPASATREDISFLYRKAWERGAKGITVFRDTSGGRQVLHRGLRPGSSACQVCVE